MKKRRKKEEGDVSSQLGLSDGVFLFVVDGHLADRIHQAKAAVLLKLDREHTAAVEMRTQSALCLFQIQLKVRSSLLRVPPALLEQRGDSVDRH